MMDGQKLATVRSMAARLRVPMRCLRGEIEAGRLPGVRAGSAILVDPEAIESALLERARQGVTGER